MAMPALLRLLAATALLTPVLPGVAAAAPGPIPQGAQDFIVWSRPTSFTTDYELFLVRPDGTGVRKLTDNAQNDAFPAWSPNGLAVAFESYSATDADIWILSDAGERNLTADPGRANRHPSWSPDGRQLVYSRQSPFTGIGQLFTIRADGTQATAITSNTGVNQQPSWSPDGQLIAFVSDRSGNHDLWVVRPNGTGLRQITDTPSVQEANPDWAPDGSRLAYDACASATFPCPGSQPDYEIVTSDPDGTARQVITDAAGIDANPAWSPDGSRLVFRSDRTGWTQIWTVNADGSDLLQLTFDNFQGGVDPDWRPTPSS